MTEMERQRSGFDKKQFNCVVSTNELICQDENKSQVKRISKLVKKENSIKKKMNEDITIEKSITIDKVPLINEVKVQNEANVGMEDNQKSSHGASFTLGNKEEEKNSLISQEVINNSRKVLLRVNEKEI